MVVIIEGVIQDVICVCVGVTGIPMGVPPFYPLRARSLRSISIGGGGGGGKSGGGDDQSTACRRFKAGCDNE